MKKGLLLMVMLLVGNLVCAQNCADRESFAQAAKQVRALQKAELPGIFYYDAEETNPDEYVREMTCYQERVNLFAVIDRVYRANPNSYNAAFNYANAMMMPVYEIEGPGDLILPQYNADNALKVLKKFNEKTANDVQAQELLYTAYEYKMFGNRRAGGLPVHRFAVNGKEVETWKEDEYGNVTWDVPSGAQEIPTIDNLTFAEIEAVYAADFPATKARLRAFENMIRLGSEKISADDYADAWLMCKVLGLHEKAEQYFKNAKEEKSECIDLYLTNQRRAVARALAKELLGIMTENMNRGR